MLIKKLYYTQNLTRRYDLFSSGKVGFSYPLSGNIFIDTECNFFEASNNIVVLKLFVSCKSCNVGFRHQLNRKLSDFEKIKKITLIKIAKEYFKGVFTPKKVMIYLYDND